MNRGEAETLARAAQEVMDNAVFQEAIAGLKEEAYDKFTNSKPKDSDARDAAYHELAALNRIQTRLQSHLDNLTMLKKGKIRSV